MLHCALRPSQGCLELGLWVTSFQNITFHPPIVHLMNPFNKVSSNLGSAMKKAGKHWRLLTLNEELLSCWKMTNIYTKKVSWSTLYIWYVIFDEYEERIYFSHTELKSIALDFNSNHPPLIYSHSHCSYSLCWYIFSFLLMFGPCDVKRNLCKIVLEIFCS